MSNESPSRGREIWWSISFWLGGGFLVYLLGYGPAVWLEPKVESKHARSLIEATFAPAGYLLFDTPLRPFGVWYVSMWVPVRRA